MAWGTESATGITVLELKHTRGATVRYIGRDEKAGSTTVLVTQLVTQDFDCEAGDIVELIVSHNAGVSKTIKTGSAYSADHRTPMFSWERIA